MIKKLLYLILVIIPMSSFAQRKVTEPKWVNRVLPISYNESYIFVRQTAIANTLEVGRSQCFSQLATEQRILNGAKVYSKSNMKTSIHQKYTNGQFSENIDRNSVSELSVEGIPFKLQAKNIDEYYKLNRNGQYVVSTLYMVAVTPDPVFDQIEVTSKYGAKGLWRSAIVPGWGQFHKHSYLKGGLILGGTAVLAGGIIFTEVTRADYAKKITMTHDKKAMATYANRRNNFALARNICIGATAALYIYNLVDAIVAPGARYVKVQKVDRNGRSYAFAPTVTYEGAPAAAATVTF